MQQRCMLLAKGKADVQNFQPGFPARLCAAILNRFQGDTGCVTQQESFKDCLYASDAKKLPRVGIPPGSTGAHHERLMSAPVHNNPLPTDKSQNKTKTERQKNASQF
eukprot:GHVU01029958.1.p2 GENE.GHVU01029958.1~~GHVU01029958.1.p2  ORF type:complete len:107 (+),score=5.18 GHVU01029958.1:576-896(+)